MLDHELRQPLTADEDDLVLYVSGILHRGLVESSAEFLERKISPDYSLLSPWGSRLGKTRSPMLAIFDNSRFYAENPIGNTATFHAADQLSRQVLRS